MAIAKPKRVLVTRQHEQAGGFINLLSAKGHYPFLLPMIEISQLCPQIEAGTYEVILFTSANAVRYFAPYNDYVRGKLYIAVGSKTAQAMESFMGISADMTPVVYDMEHVKALLLRINLNNARILSPGAVERSPLPVEELESYGATVYTPAIYATYYAGYPNGYLDEFITKNNIDTITLCSPSAAKSFVNQVSTEILALDIVSIGTTTANYLSNKGISSRYPDEFTTEGMVDII